jgi:hypothetical protein
MLYAYTYRDTQLNCYYFIAVPHAIVSLLRTSSFLVVKLPLGFGVGRGVACDGVFVHVCILHTCTCSGWLAVRGVCVVYVLQRMDRGLKQLLYCSRLSTVVGLRVCIPQCTCTCTVYMYLQMNLHPVYLVLHSVLQFCTCSPCYSCRYA